MRAELNHSSAQTRHPEEVAQILSKLGTSDPAAVNWSYETCLRIDGTHHLAQELKGIDRFIGNAANHGLSLEGQLIANPKKKARIELDPVELARDRSRCPQEIYAIMQKPAGWPLWVWRPRLVASPGWNEAVIVDGITDGKSTLLRFYEDTSYAQYPSLLEQVDGGRWRETSPDASGRVDTFGRALQSTIGKYARTGTLQGATQASTKALANSNLRSLSQEELAKIHAQFPGNHLLGPDASAKLIEDLHRFGLPGQLGLPTPALPEESKNVWDARIAHGRRFAWGQSINQEDLADYGALMQNTGVSSGNAMDVFSSLANPAFQDNRAIANAIITHLAMGEDRATALASAQNQVASRPPPSPTSKWGF